ncbi:CE1759 family FMN reductase [Arthrobacter sp. UM1]|uniref:CE1759 family FMN reductase n=1 Tax=Arthrobacter sp. UM1 TaxID=2766776 RepID=UPI001CF61373|nr:CE1759 family FMN reductase [Arthrobacter sp. UM1]MCB4209113.1 NAD(P)H-dependent oxidoreductase [Arthrobacter sp. UM1]
MAADSATLVTVNGGLSSESSTKRLVDQICGAAQRRASELGVDLAVKSIDLRDFARELGEGQITGFAADGLKDAIESLSTADALVVASPTYKASYSGLFKSFWDLTVDSAIAGVPTLLAATGGSVRHSLMVELHLRPLFSYLKALVLPTAVFAASEDWGEAGLDRRVEAAAAELVGQLTRGPGFGQAEQKAAEDGRGRNSVRRTEAVDPFADVPSFDEMMSSLRKDP